jgi:uncharacterized coiled-coil DUF342 family protein
MANKLKIEKSGDEILTTKVWLQLAQWFLRRRVIYEMLMNGRRMTDDELKGMTIAHLAFIPKRQAS